MSVVRYLENWRVVVGAVGALLLVLGWIPDRFKPITRGAHETDIAYTNTVNAAKSVHYYEWKKCDRQTGLPNGKVLSVFREDALTMAYDEYKKWAQNDYPLRDKDQETKCQMLYEDEL